MTISRVTTTRGPAGARAARSARTRGATGTGLRPGRWSSCWLLRGSRPWSGTHECACLRLCRGPRAARSSGVSRLLVFSAPRRRASPPSRAGRGRRTSGVEVRHPCRSRPMPVSPSVSASGTSFSFRADGDALAAVILLTQILYDRYSPRYSTSESYMCTTYCAHVSRNRRPLASPLPVARAQASAAQERLCKPAPPPMWSSSSQPSCSRLLEMRLIPLAFGGCQIAEEVLSFFGIGNDSA